MQIAIVHFLQANFGLLFILLLTFVLVGGPEAVGYPT